MICENCNKEHDGSYGSGRFCSSKCARAFSTKIKRKEINEKVSLKLKKNPDYFCKDCDKKLIKKTITGYCSNCYLTKYNKVFSIEVRTKISNANKGRSRWNIHRNQISYAERFWKKVLENNKIDFKREVAIKQADEQHCPKDKEYRILYEADLSPVFTYVKTKYGENFINLYEY